MARIKATTPDRVRGFFRKLLFRMARRDHGGVVPGILQVLAPNLNITLPMYRLYSYLNLRKSSPLTRLQREMVALVVNGKINGAP